MYYYPVNNLEFKKGYGLGVAKGRRIERKLALVCVIVFTFLFLLVLGLVNTFSNNCSYFS